MTGKFKIIPSVAAVVLLLYIVTLLFTPQNISKQADDSANNHKYTIEDIIQNAGIPIGGGSSSNKSKPYSKSTSSEVKTQNTDKTIIIFNTENNNFGFLPNSNMQSESEETSNDTETSFPSEESSSDISTSTETSLPTSTATSTTTSDTPITPPPTVTAEELKNETNRVIATYNVQITFSLPYGYDNFKVLLSRVLSIENSCKFLQPQIVLGIGITEFNITETDKYFDGTVIHVNLKSTSDEMVNIIGDYLKNAIFSSTLTANLWRYNPDDFDPTTPRDIYNYSGDLIMPCYFLSSESQQSQKHEIAELSRAILLNDRRLYTLPQEYPLYKKMKALCTQIVKKYPDFSENIIVKNTL